jgi:predicted dehydrogenase
VLCEKPLATSYPEALEMARAAAGSSLINMVNFSYRSSSALARAIEWCREGRLGRILHVDAQYLQGWLCAHYWGDFRQTPGLLWRLSTAHGSKGVLGDIGVHILDFATAPVGPIRSVRCRLHNFAEKVPGNTIGDYRLDANDSAFMTLEFANGAMGSVLTTRAATGHKNSLLLKIHGTKGALSIDLDAGYDQIDCCTVKADGLTTIWERLDTDSVPSIYERFIAAISSGQPDPVDFMRGAEIQKLLDACMVSHETDRTIELAGFEG